jgi:hypothetical protein
VQRRIQRSAIARRNQNDDVVGRRFGVFDEDVEVTLLVEDAGIEQLVFHLLAGTRAIGNDEFVVRECALRIFVEILQVRVRRCGIEIEVILLDVFAVIALSVRQAEQPFFQNRVGAVPEAERKTELLMIVTDAGKAVFAPAIGPGARVIVREVIPRVAGITVVLTDRPPLPLAQVGPPALPDVAAHFVLLQSQRFPRH